jgi:hypothetical protein
MHLATAPAEAFATGRPRAAMACADCSAKPIAKRRRHRYHVPMAANDIFDAKAVLIAQLVELRTEHRDLDEAINRLQALPDDDELALRRLKKRKLLLKDRIAALERQLDPDEYA